MSETPTSRLAPSPTGALHLGNARTFLINWALARQRGWRLLLRMEDLDGPRVKPESAASVLDTLAWLGITYDGDVLVQSHDLAPYHAALAALAHAGLVYPSTTTRGEIEASVSAPHFGEHEVRFPSALRPPAPWPHSIANLDVNYRLAVVDGDIDVRDEFCGHVRFSPAREVGDFVVWTRRGVPAYQLAVVVDDARQGVTDVVRGADLLPSAARQQLIYAALGWRAPNWWHVPLVVGNDGKRLAKRHGDSRLATYRARGASAERVIGLLAAWCGLCGSAEEMDATEFLRRFDIKQLSSEPIVFTAEQDRWLARGV
ncbi:MAG: glutamate--tRNA ligase family protein [Planctomycetota bacterium]